MFKTHLWLRAYLILLLGFCLHIKITFGPTNSIGPKQVIYLKDQTYYLGLNETSYIT
jgi:hypothetical protein